MASVQDVINAAYRVSEGAKQVGDRSAVCANALDQHAARLTPLVQGSRSGQEAAVQVQAASRAVRECAARMLTLQSRVNDFIRDVSK
jgi:hypothetical protein